jgi:hypothetical protein
MMNAVFVICLLVSGITAFPLYWETGFLVRWFGQGTSVGGLFPELAGWLTRIHAGVSYNAAHYPFMAYGTDWLAFSHIVIAVFFIGAAIDPVRNIWIVKAGMIACILVPVLAFVCGPVRGIPLYWRLIDSGFGVFGFIPLSLIHRWTKKLGECE